MVGRYFQGRSVGSADDVDVALHELKQWEIAHLNGTWEDTTAAQTAELIRGVYGLRVEVTAIERQQSDKAIASDTTSDQAIVSDKAIGQIKRAVADGKLVIVPTAGRKLGNPNFTAPGPLYHMLVITGYTNDGQFIVNDPGIWQGAGWQYSTGTVMNAIGDWNGGDPAHGTTTVLIVTKG